MGPDCLSCSFVGALIPESEVALAGADDFGSEVPWPLSLMSGSLAGLPELAAFPVAELAFDKASGIAFAGGAEDVEAS